MSEAYNDKSKVTTLLGSISPYFKIGNDLEYRMLYSINYSSGSRRASIKQFINLTDVKDKGVAFIGNGELVAQRPESECHFRL